MSQFLYLIRYPTVQVDLSTPSTHWPLSAHGLQQARMLAELAFWSHVTSIYTNTELKGIETTELITAKYPHLKRHALMSFNEAQRLTGPLSVEAYQQCARNFFVYPDKIAAFGWASNGSVRSLVVGSYQKIMAELRQQQQSAAIIAHGLALTLLRGHIIGQVATFEDWCKIPFASVAKVDVSSGQLVQDFTPLDLLQTEPTAG